MKTYFYSHLVEIETITTKLNEIDIAVHEREELVEIVHDTIHHHVIDAVLDELNEEDKKQFLKLLVHNDHDTVWQHLKQKVANIEDKIKSAINTIKQEFHADMP